MRVATARAASRRGSSITIRRPPPTASASSASGTTVLLPAPGGASSTAAPGARSAACSGASTASMGRPERISSPDAHALGRARGTADLPGLTPKATYQASTLRTTPLTRKRAGLCGSVSTCARMRSSVSSACQTCA